MLILISFKLCCGQDGFRKELPFSELRLDTPFTFTHFDDFQIIDYSKDSIKGERIYSCKVNEQGNELFCYEKRIGDTGLYNRSSMCIYDSHGKIKSEEIYDSRGTYRVGLPAYDSKGRKVKYELFEYSKRYDLKPGVLPDSVESISVNDTVNMNKLKVDSNYNIYSSWQQTDLWTWQYDEQGRVAENYHVERFNQKYKSKTIYDKKGRIQKELGYRNFPPSNKNEKEITDSLTDFTDYKYFKDGYVRKTKSYFYSTIDTFLVNSKNQTLKKSFYAKNIDPGVSNVDSIPFDHIWPGFTFMNTTNSNSFFKFCRVLYSAQAIYFGTCTQVLLDIEDSRFSFNDGVIKGYSCAGGSGYPVTINRTDFTFNNYCFGYNFTSSAYIDIYSSRFLNNGIAFRRTESINIYNSILCGNGIASDARWAAFYSCIFLNNNVAVKEEDGYQTLLDSCIIAFNDTGIIFQGSVQAVYNNHNNKFCNNYYYSAVVQGPYNVDMSGNCWCSTSSSAIAQTIYDGYDNVSLGLLQYSPFITCDSSDSPVFTSCDSILLSVSNQLSFLVKPLIYPNPATNTITVIFNKTNNINIFNLLGETVIRKEVSFNTNGKVEFDISSLSSGLYFIKTDNEAMKFVKK